MATKDIKETLKEATKGILTEDLLQSIEATFNESVEKRANDKVTVQLESALTKQDSLHTGQLKVLLEKIDNDHTGKMKKVVKALNENHTRKLKQVIKKYQSTVNEDAEAFKNSLITTISNYLELYLEKTVPLTQIKEAVKIKKSNRVIEELRKMLGVDLAFSQEVIKEGLLDGKQKIDKASKANTDLVTENNQLKNTVQKMESSILLEKLTIGLPEEKKKYCIKVLIDKGTDFINENFNYTLSLFDKDQEVLLENLKSNATPVTKKIDRPVKKQDESKVINENASAQEVDASMMPYMQELGKYK